MYRQTKRNPSILAEQGGALGSGPQLSHYDTLFCIPELFKRRLDYVRSEQSEPVDLHNT